MVKKIPLILFVALIILLTAVMFYSYNGNKNIATKDNITQSK